MADITAKRFDEMDSMLGGVFVRARAELGVSSFGMQVINLPPNFSDYPEHAHVGMPFPEGDDGQEEVYVPLSGSAVLVAGDERVALTPGMACRVGPAQSRKIVTGDAPFQMLALGAMPGKPYQAPAISEIGAPPPAIPH